MVSHVAYKTFFEYLTGREIFCLALKLTMKNLSLIYNFLFFYYSIDIVNKTADVENPINIAIENENEHAEKNFIGKYVTYLKESISYVTNTVRNFFSGFVFFSKFFILIYF
jgi:hypothetical protein